MRQSVATIGTVSNGLSCLRVPLAFLFLLENPWIRCAAVFGAMITDCLDGYLARRYGQTTQIGALLDPLADKFFAFFALSTLFIEKRLSGIEMAALLSRDFAVLIFGIYLYLTNNLMQVRFQALWSGKIATALQFVVLISLCLDRSIPGELYGFFAVLGILALIELGWFHREFRRP